MKSQARQDKEMGYDYFEDLVGVFQTMKNEALIDLVEGRFDAVGIAKALLVSRGIGRNGKWVGFKEAARNWIVN